PCLYTQGRTELHDAAERGDVEVVERLLSTSVNINSRTEEEGDTALLLASLRGDVEVVRLLLKAGAVVFIPDKVWRTCHVLLLVGYVRLSLLA
ncbi:Ankyrin repeat domain-containing protein 17, partial [Geodia barretti]